MVKHPYLLCHHEIDKKITYRQISNICRTQSQKLNVSGLVLQLPLRNPLKPGVQSGMKMNRWCSNYIWVVDNFIAY